VCKAAEMASLIRVGFTRVIGSGKTTCTLNGVRFISGKTMKVDGQRIQKPAPWNYKQKRFTMLNYFFDKTTARLDENSKIIVVEGPPASGKTKFAKALAEELEMHYFPEANLDMININDYGYDLRQLDQQVPESCRTFDVNDFLTNPKHFLAASFQIKQYQVKYSQYIDALAHLLSSGQGVILDRCAYSDFVFVEAMASQGYMSKGARSVYYDIRKNTIRELLRPHLVLYLDVPVPKVIENIKKRNISYEVNSQAMNPNYLQALEYAYKHEYLKQIGTHSELLIYDWSNGGDVEVVVEDIERIDFNKYDDQDPQLKDWDLQNEEDWACMRNYYCDRKDFIMTYMNVPRYDVPELVTDAEDIFEYRQVLEAAPGEKYTKGYDKSMGDQGILFKTDFLFRTTLPERERRDPQGNFTV